MRADRGFDHPHHCRHYDYLLSSYYVPDTDSPLNSPRVGHYCPCHTDEDTKAQRMISPRPWMEGAARLGGGTPLWTPCPEPFPPASGASWSAGLCRSVLLRFQAFPGLAWLPSPASSLLSCSEQLFERRWKRKRHLGPQAWSSPLAHLSYGLSSSSKNTNILTGQKLCRFSKGRLSCGLGGIPPGPGRWSKWG